MTDGGQGDVNMTLTLEGEWEVDAQHPHEGGDVYVRWQAGWRLKLLLGWMRLVRAPRHAAARRQGWAGGRHLHRCMRDGEWGDREDAMARERGLGLGAVAVMRRRAEGAAQRGLAPVSGGVGEPRGDG